jgi:UPF0755 protein
LSRLGKARRVLLLAALAAALALLAWQRETRLPALPRDSPPVTLIVTPGMSVTRIGERLYAVGLVHHPLIFRALVLRKGVASRLKAGEYLLPSSLSPDEIVGVLVRGEVVRRQVTFPEGREIEEMARIAEAEAHIPAKAFLLAARDAHGIHDLDPLATDLEGYLFPDTYDVPGAQQPGAALVARMTARFREVIAPLVPRLAERGLTLRQVITLASLVELETADPQERPRIAAVFLNRLKRKMPLQADPSVIYALRRSGRYDGNIHKQDLDLSSPYNTYRVQGLPPGPIGCPGRAAIEAVLSPAPGDELYFVSRNDGTHVFSATLRGHERAVDRFQRRLRGSAN